MMILRRGWAVARVVRRNVARSALRRRNIVGRPSGAEAPFVRGKMQGQAERTQPARIVGPCQAALELQLDGELDKTGIVNSLVDDAERAAIDVRIRQPELCMVEEVEKLGPEIQAHAVAERQGEVFNGGEIGVDIARPGHWGARSISELAYRSRGEALRVKPLL